MSTIERYESSKKIERSAATPILMEHQTGTNVSKCTYTYLPGEFHSMLLRRIRLQCLPLDVVEEVWTATKEFMVRKFPDLVVCRSTLCPWGLTVYKVSDQIRNTDEWNKPTLLILWNPYMFS
jgi:hypothetical protein